MTSYKKAAAEFEEKLQEALHQNDVLTSQLADVHRDIYSRLCDKLSNEEAKEVLLKFAGRVEDKDELMLLIRAVAAL